MAFDTDAEARMWKVMLDESGSGVVDVSRRLTATQSPSRNSTESIAFQPRGDTRALQGNCVTTEI